MYTLTTWQYMEGYDFDAEYDFRDNLLNETYAPIMYMIYLDYSIAPLKVYNLDLQLKICIIYILVFLYYS